MTDAIANAPGMCMLWRRVQTFTLTIYANSKHCNIRSDVRDFHFHLSCPACPVPIRHGASAYHIQ
jgi:hypothetical protein